MRHSRSLPLAFLIVVLAAAGSVHAQTDGGARDPVDAGREEDAGRQGEVRTRGPQEARSAHEDARSARTDDRRDAAARDAEGPRATPQRAVAKFLELARAGRYVEAAEGLDAPADEARITLARQLHAVLERKLYLDVDSLSTSSDGDLNDGVSRNVEELGKLPVPGRKDPEPVRLVRRTSADGVVWLFSRRTLLDVPKWYETIDDRYFREHLPASLLRTGPFGILYWQWLALALLVPVAFIVGSILGRGVRFVVMHLVKRTKTTLDDELVPRLAGPLRMFLALVLFDFGLRFALLSPDAEQAIARIRHMLMLVTVATALVRTAHVLGDSAIRASYASGNAGARSFVPIAVRTADLVVFALSAVWVFAILGYDVRGILAGLGVGGVVVALAAKSTVENLLGAFSLGFDQPLREGDSVTIDGKTGTVERLGLRSTRIRTPERTVLTYPNGKLADMVIESMTARDRFRFYSVVGLVYGTTAAQVRAIRDSIDAMLGAHPNLAPDARLVRLRALGASSLELEISAWFATADFAEFARVREDLLIGILDIVEKNGSGLAFPTQTLHVVGAEPPRKPDA